MSLQVVRYVFLRDNEEVEVNVVTLIGRLATDVDVRELADGRKLAGFLLAVDRPGADGKADFVRVVAWNRQAELCGQYLSRGERIAVDGRLRSRSWEEADGKRRSAIEVAASSVQFLSGPDHAEVEEAPLAAA